MKRTPMSSKELSKQLQEGNAAQQIEALEALREAGEELFIPDLLDLIGSNETDAKVRRHALAVVVDVKRPALVGAMRVALARWADSDFLPELISICWQSRADFSPLLPELLPLCVGTNLRARMELITALEMMLPKVPIAQLREAKEQVKKLLAEANGAEKPLLEEVQSMLRAAIEAQ